MQAKVIYPKKWIFFRNSAVFKEIQGLDAETDHCRIVQLLASYEFPWDMARALEIALFRTYASPNISKLLDSTGEFRQNGQKRYDDTGVLIGEFIENGYDSEFGKRAIAQMNKIHAHFRINNEDYLYVLSTFIFDPIHWLEKFGWRKLLEKEKQALFYFFFNVGLRMNLQNIPPTLEDFKKFAQEYENQHFYFAQTNQNVANATVKIVENWYPKIFRFMIKPAVYAMIDANMRRAFGYPEPANWLKWLLPNLLKMRKPFIRYLNFEKSPTLLGNSLNRTYPKGYTIEKIGPKNLVK
jgi:hypothetical protein